MATGRRWVVIIALTGTVMAPAATRAADRKADVPDAELLLDLDLLKEPDFAKQQDLMRRMPLIERIRVLENLRLLEAPTEAMSVQKGEPK